MQISDDVLGLILLEINDIEDIYELDQSKVFNIKDKIYKNYILSKYPDWKEFKNPGETWKDLFSIFYQINEFIFRILSADVKLNDIDYGFGHSPKNIFELLFFNGTHNFAQCIFYLEDIIDISCPKEFLDDVWFWDYYYDAPENPEFKITLRKLYDNIIINEKEKNLSLEDFTEKIKYSFKCISDEWCNDLYNHETEEFGQLDKKLFYINDNEINILYRIYTKVLDGSLNMSTLIPPP